MRFLFLFFEGPPTPSLALRTAVGSENCISGGHTGQNKEYDVETYMSSLGLAGEVGKVFDIHC